MGVKTIYTPDERFSISIESSWVGAPVVGRLGGGNFRRIRRRGIFGKEVIADKMFVRGLARAGRPEFSTGSS